MPALPAAGVQGPDLWVREAQQNIRRHSPAENPHAQAAQQEGVPAGHHADGPQGEPVPGPAEATAPDRRTDQSHLGVREGFLGQRGEAGPRHSLGQLLRSP